MLWAPGLLLPLPGCNVVPPIPMVLMARHPVFLDNSYSLQIRIPATSMNKPTFPATGTADLSVEELGPEIETLFNPSSAPA